MDFTALNITGGWIALGLMLLFFLAEAVINLRNLFVLKPTVVLDDGEVPGTASATKSAVYLKAAGLLVILPAIIFNTWFLFGGGHDFITKYMLGFTSSVWFQGGLLIMLLVLVIFMPTWLLRLWKPQLLKIMATDTKSAPWQTDKLRTAVVIFAIMFVLLMLVCWLLWRFKLITNVLIALFFFYRLFRKTHWFRGRSVSRNKKNELLGTDDERYALLSSWLSRVGSGVTALFYTQGSKGVFVRGSGGSKALEISFFKDQPLSSEELILYSARAITRNRSVHRQKYSQVLLVTGAAGACIYFWAAYTSALPLALGFEKPYYFAGQLLGGYFTFVVSDLLVRWLIRHSVTKMNEETDTFILANTDIAVQELLKRKLEAELKDAGDIQLSENSWLLTPRYGTILKNRLKRVKEHLDKYT